ncbi:hypothetical protein [Vulcanisaeta distributa]|uniref:hypothetical protein n=1 Tax=Vulcanisaeta distributa TaxID=164451 RepID=UPI001FB48ED7|nr:hypothetical protein [Vulcanisaeta distributa]
MACARVQGRNGRGGYEYTESCVLISLGDSGGEARRLRDELVGLGVRVRKVVGYGDRMQR